MTRKVTTRARRAVQRSRTETTAKTSKSPATTAANLRSPGLQ
jgi:hypothetical protein